MLENKKLEHQRIAAVVVTYNRKNHLRACLDAILSQSYAVDKILLIDNASTDGTPESLKVWGFLNQPSIEYVRLSSNQGGAEGFYEGIKKASQGNYHWVWLMDDDVCPRRDALETLIDKIFIIDKRVGFASSKVVWKDGSVHLMNVPQIQFLFECEKLPFNAYDEHGIIIVKTASFASMLISTDAIKEVGLPLKDFFIWFDDVEYSARITHRGYLGMYVKDSIVDHRTAENYNTDIFTDRPANAWKHFFGIRNYLYCLKKKGVLLYCAYFLYYGIVRNIDILLKRKDARIKFLIVNTRAVIASAFFFPKVEH